MAANPYASEEFLQQLLGKAIAAHASDVHLKVGQPPGVRVDGVIRFFKVERLMPDDTEAVARIILGPNFDPVQMQHLLEHDCSYAIEGLGRFRVNVYKQRGCFSVALRVIPARVPTVDELQLPHAISDLARRERGMVLLVGATGSGKSTTLAAMVNLINAEYSKHIVTIEDPIEYLHTDQRSCVSQREVGFDTESFAKALRAALRQDPDVILVGEIRDSVTMEIALQAAETGHLLLSTMHTPDVSRTVNRMLSLGEDESELRDRLGDCMQGIIAQRLVPKMGGGVTCCPEILVVSGTVREAIKRPEHNPALKELMEHGVVPYGMQTFKMALEGLARKGIISKETAKANIAF